VATTSVRQILELGKSLSPSDRAAWQSEGRQRTEAILRGDATGVPADEVHARIARRVDDKAT
jgi:hypothetical protein